MKIRILMFPALVILLSECAGQLDVGTGLGPGETEGGPERTGEGGALACTPGDCANYSFTCTQGAPTNVRCVVDTSSQFPSPICTLSGDCPPGSVATCSWAPTPCSGSGPCSAIVGGSGVVTVAAGASSTVLTAYFERSESDGEGQTFGACVYQSGGADLEQSGVVGDPAPRPGTVTVTAPGFEASITSACDGIYAPGTFPEAIAPGALVSFGWTARASAGSGDGFPAVLPSVPGPHPVTLAASDALSAASPSVSRATDLPVDWTVTGTPLSLEQVVVQLTKGVASLTCTFDANAGSGVVPADALLAIGAGNVSYEVYSLHEADLGMADEGGWYLRFLVQTTAATAAGVAKGTLTLE